MNSSRICDVEFLYGVYPPEHDGIRDFRWTQQVCEVQLAPLNGDGVDRPTSVSVPIGTPSENLVRIFSDERVLVDVKLSEGWTVFRFELDLSVRRKLRVETDTAIKDGNRVLGIMLGELVFSSFSSNPRFYLTRNTTRPGQGGCEPKPIISAYYYLWYFTPEGIRSRQRFAGKWSERYMRALLEPPQYPTLGEYVMNDPVVIESHIDWAADHGIDCFICNWEGMVGHRKFLSENLVHILQGSVQDGSWSVGKIPYSSTDSTGHGWDATSQGWHGNGYPIRNLKRIKFSVLVESRLIVDEWPPRADSHECLKSFSDAVTYMAENFFGSPQWQRIDNKPVVYVYEVYSWIGDRDAFAQFRTSLDDAVTAVKDPLTGKRYEGIYVIADVLYPYPQDMDRLEVFDAVTGYQPYPPVSSRVADTGQEGWQYRGTELFTCPAFEEYHRKFAAWGREKSVAVIPTVIPRYNDRGVRGAIDNYAYPPASEAPYMDVQDARNGNLFKRNIEAQLRWMSSDVNMLNINSWNEWFEDTAIEPVGYIPEMNIPDYCDQTSNVGTSTNRGRDQHVPDRIVIYDHDGHTWIDTPPEIKKEGIDITQGYEWPCYGFDYLFALKDCFGLSYSANVDCVDE